jgi:hypothetical protein
MGHASGTIARLREVLVVSVAGIALAILMTWPLAADLAHVGRTLPNDADGQFSIWNIAWVARTVVADPLDLFDANIFHPHKLTLAYSEANILPGTIGAPVWWVTRNPWLTLNVVLLFGFASSFACTYLLLRHLTGSRAGATCGGIVYAFCPYVFSHLSHIQLLMTGGIPLSMLMVHRLVDSFRLKPEATQVAKGVASGFSRKGVALGLALAAQALSCAYYGIFAGLMVGFATLLLAVTRGLLRNRAFWTSISLAAATSLLIVGPFFIPYKIVQAESGFGRSVADTAHWAAKPHGYLVSSSNAHRWLLEWTRQFGPWDEVLFPGIFALVAGIAGMVIVVRRPPRDRETALLYGLLAVLSFWASFGPNAGLYRLLYYLPTFSFLRAPSRLGLVVVLCLAVFAAFAVRALIERVAPRLKGVIAAAAVAAAIGDLVIVPLHWYRAPIIPPGYAALAGLPRGALAEFPFYGERIAFPLHAQYMLFSTSHWLPMVNGYSDVIPMDFREAAVVLADFPSNDAFAVLAKRRVRYIAVHWDMYAGRDGEIRRRLDSFLPNLRVLNEDSRMTLFEVVRYP